jgi:N-acetylmuramoyl-L-alanine amidase
MAILDLSRAPHGGRVKLLPENSTSPRTSPRLIILHTIVGDAQSAEAYFRTGTNLESTFIVAGRWGRLDWPDGYAVQLMSTEREADANYRANPFAISIETEDDGSPDDTPWTAKQLDTLAWLIRECARIHDIPIRKADRWDGSGVGWHVQFGAPGPWTPVSKSCPGRARIAQIPALIERARTGGQEGLSMADIDDILHRLDALEDKVTFWGDLIYNGRANGQTVQGNVSLISVRDRLVSLAGQVEGLAEPGPVNVQLSAEQVAQLAGQVEALVNVVSARLANAAQAAANALTQAQEPSS